MATVTHRVATADTSGSATYPTGSFTPAAGDLLIAFAVVSASTDPGSMTASNNGITFTEIGTVAWNVGANTVYAYVANQLVPASPSSMTVTMNVPGDTGTGAVVAVASVAGMSKTGSTAIRQFKTHESTSGNYQIVFDSAPLTGNPQLGVIGNGDNPAGITPPASWTEAVDTGYNNPATGLEYAYRNSGGTTDTITWSVGDSVLGGIIVELDASSSVITRTADTATLTLAGITPALAGSGTVARTADTAALTLAGQAVALAGTGTVATTVGPAALALTGQTPGLTGSGAAAAAAGPAALTLTGVGVAAETGLVAVVDPAVLTLTGLAPLLAGTGTVTTTAATATLTLAGQAVTLTGTGTSAVAVDPAVLLLAGIDPAAAGTGTVTLDTDPAALLLTGHQTGAVLGMVFVDVTIQVGGTRVGTITLNPTRVGTAETGPTRVGTASADPTRVGTVTLAGTRVGTAQAAPTRIGSIDVDDTRIGTAEVGDTRTERGA